MDPKPINFRPSELEDLIIERLIYDLEKLTEKKMSKSEIVRHCIRVAGAELMSEADFNELLHHALKFK